MDGESKYSRYHHIFSIKAFCSSISIKTTVEANGLPTSTASEDVNPQPTAVLDHREENCLLTYSWWLACFSHKNHPQIFRPEGITAMTFCVTHPVCDLINSEAEPAIYWGWTEHPLETKIPPQLKHREAEIPTYAPLSANNLFPKLACTWRSWSDHYPAKML